jgi:hypothetical protein
MSELARKVDLAESRLTNVEGALLSDSANCEQMLAKAVELHDVFKKELLQELQVLRNEMHAHRGGSDTLSLERRLQATEQMLSELQQAHQRHDIETNALRQQLEVAMRKCEEQLSRADSSFSALLQENLAACVEAVEQIVDTKLSMHNNSAALESSKLEVVGQQCQCAKQSEDMESHWREMQQQCEALAHKADAILSGIVRLPSAPSSGTDTISVPGSMPGESNDATVKSEDRISDAETGLRADLKRVEAAGLRLESTRSEALNLAPRVTALEMPVLAARQSNAPVCPSAQGAIIGRAAFPERPQSPLGNEAVERLSKSYVAAGSLRTQRSFSTPLRRTLSGCSAIVQSKQPTLGDLLCSTIAQLPRVRSSSATRLVVDVAKQQPQPLHLQQPQKPQHSQQAQQQRHRLL